MMWLDEFNDFHFSETTWLYALFIIPLVGLFLYLLQKKYSHTGLEKFIDPHLIPYLVKSGNSNKQAFWGPYFVWSLVLAGLIFALAGPRWTYREIETFSRDQSLVVLLDLSESMNASDIKPTRLSRAKQKIEDLLNHSQGVKIGLIAFAADPHMISPLTTDKETIRHMLPSLSTDLVYVQGSRLSPAFEMASRLLEAEPGSNKAILVISDGGFEDSRALMSAKKLSEKGIYVYTMGVGTSEGAPLMKAGKIVKKSNVPIILKLDQDRLVELAKAGQGKYLDVVALDETVVLKDLESRAITHEALGKKNRLWDEGFYWALFPLIPAILWWFRRGSILMALMLTFAPFAEMQAVDLQPYFMNVDEQAKHALEEGEHEKAAELFEDPYRKGVALYKAGKFEESEKSFDSCTRPEVRCQALYNKGNALAKQNKFDEAIEAYEKVLQECPEHKKAKDNLELVKELMKNNPPPPSKDKQKNKDKNKEKKKDKNQEKSSDKDNNKESEDNPNPDKNNKDSKEENNESTSPEKKQDTPQDAQNQPNESSSEKDQELHQQDQPENTPDESEKENVKKENGKEAKGARSQQDQDADLWLNQIQNDPESFLKNKFYIESKKNKTEEGVDPW